MFFVLFVASYIVGQTATWVHMNKLFDECYPDGSKIPDWEAIVALTGYAVYSTFWPLYWAMKLIDAPAQKLLPGPKELV